jgi:hypothetical protein
MLSDERSTLPEVASGMQLDHALQIAERLLEQAERTSGRCRVLRVTEVGVVGLVLFVLTGWAGLDRFAGWVRLTTVSVIGILLGVCVAAVVYVVLEIPLRRRLARDSRAVIGISELVRELMPLVARHEKWNELRTDLFKTRLSRFPIGPKGIR